MQHTVRLSATLNSLHRGALNHATQTPGRPTASALRAAATIWRSLAYSVECDLPLTPQDIARRLREADAHLATITPTILPPQADLLLRTFFPHTPDTRPDWLYVLTIRHGLTPTTRTAHTPQDALAIRSAHQRVGAHVTVDRIPYAALTPLSLEELTALSATDPTA